MTDSDKRDPFEIANTSIAPGKVVECELPVTRLATGNQVSIPLRVFHGKYPGPVIWISACLHGDEIQGVEIIRRVMEQLNPRKLHGTIIMVPIVNIHGFLNQDRYLPDRRDLNRSFPGSAKGSLASQIAYLFMNEIVEPCDFGIDLHTGSDGRNNLPQVRTNMDNPRLRELAKQFGAPVMLHSKVRDGSLREAANEKGSKVLLYEGGEANRFQEESIVAAVNGIIRILLFLTMIDRDNVINDVQSLECHSSSWLRAKRTGIALLQAELGSMVEKGQIIGIIHDSTGNRLSRMRAHRSGIIIGRLECPLVNQGDAVYHIAEVLEK